MAKKRLANSELVRDLHREYTDGPDEIRVSVNMLMLTYNVHLVQVMKNKNCYNAKYCSSNNGNNNNNNNSDNF